MKTRLQTINHVVKWRDGPMRGKGRKPQENKDIMDWARKVCLATWQ